MDQWCNLTLTRWFWETKVCLQVKFPKYVSLVARLGKQLLEKQILKIILRYSLIKWYQFLSIQYGMCNTSFHFKHLFLLPACSSQSHATSCSSLMSYHRVNNKCNRVKGRHWRWLIYALCYFLWLNMSHVTTTVLEIFTNSTGSTCVRVSF